MKKYLFLILLAFIFIASNGQLNEDSVQIGQSFSTAGWSNEAVSIGYATAPSVLGLMFISALVSEWNAGYFGIPASVLIFSSPPVIFAGGRSVRIPKSIGQPRAQLGWTLYALSLVPTVLALYGFTTDWGSTIPLTLTSGVLGSASIIAMTTYAYFRGETGRQLQENSKLSFSAGISPIPRGAAVFVSLRF